MSQQVQRGLRPAEEQQHKGLGYIGMGIAFVVLLGVIGCSVANTPAPQAVEGVQTFANIVAGHTEGPVNYEQTPPVGDPMLLRGKIAVFMIAQCKAKMQFIVWNTAPCG